MLEKCLSAKFRHLLSNESELHPSQLLAIGSAPKSFEGAGWYLNILTRGDDPSWFALYPGQSANVTERITYHRGKYDKLDKPSLHYFTWRSPGVRSTFVSLGRLTPDIRQQDDWDLLLNVGEQLIGTILQAFPEVMLPEYLPSGVPVRDPHRGLMIARAMNQGRFKAQDDTWMLYKSSNPIVQSFVNTYYKESLDKGRQT